MYCPRVVKSSFLIVRVGIYSGGLINSRLWWRRQQWFLTFVFCVTGQVRSMIEWMPVTLKEGLVCCADMHCVMIPVILKTKLLRLPIVIMWGA